MSPAQRKVHSILQSMLVTGILLVPAAMATPALQDLTDLRTVINAAASTIGDVNNPNRGWGFSLGGSGQPGTADLINNVTTTILRSKWQLDTNKTMWLTPANLTNETGTPPALTPTLPISSSLLQPSILPTTTPPPSSLNNTTTNNTTTDLSTPYIDYISAIPNLSTSLISLGRAYHREMNSPVYQAIAGLQQGLAVLQSSMLQNDLIRANAVVRTLRATSSLEDAHQAWSRLLNLPGSSTSSSSSSSASSSGSNNMGDLESDSAAAAAVVVKRSRIDGDGLFSSSSSSSSSSTARIQTRRDGKAVAPAPIRQGTTLYTHQDLWARGDNKEEEEEEKKKAATILFPIPAGGNDDDDDEEGLWYAAVAPFSRWKAPSGGKGVRARMFVA